jgi:RloB-like protein
VSRKKDLVPSRARRRPYSPKARKKRFLLYCEGEATEPEYFHGFARHLRSSLIEVKVADEQGKDPKKLVQLAKAARDNARRAARRDRDDSLKYDEVWCVFDGSEHARLGEAIDQGLVNSIGLAVSNPSFELWILVHFQDQYAFITVENAYDAVRRHIPDYDKHLDFAKVEGRVHDATRRARKMEMIARRNGRWFDNPSTAVWQLVARLCDQAKIPISKL